MSRPQTTAEGYACIRGPDAAGVCDGVSTGDIGSSRVEIQVWRWTSLSLDGPAPPWILQQHKRPPSLREELPSATPSPTHTPHSLPPRTWERRSHLSPQACNSPGQHTWAGNCMPVDSEGMRAGELTPPHLTGQVLTCIKERRLPLFTHCLLWHGRELVPWSQKGGN